jgi:hypothetical protein
MCYFVIAGQCLCWPLHFKHALPLQTAYVFTSLAAMRSVKCTLQSPVIHTGAHVLCNKVQMTVNYLTAFSTEGQLSCMLPGDVDGEATPAPTAAAAAGAADQASKAAAFDSSSSSSGSCGSGSLCGSRSGEEVLFFWLVTFGLLLPLYIMYLRELTYKQRFLRTLLCQQQQQLQQAAFTGSAAGAAAGESSNINQQQQQQQQLVHRQQEHAPHITGNAFLNGVLGMGPLLHFAALCILLMVGAVLCELLLVVLRPPQCL